MKNGSVPGMKIIQINISTSQKAVAKRSERKAGMQNTSVVKNNEVSRFHVLGINRSLVTKQLRELEERAIKGENIIVIQKKIESPMRTVIYWFEDVFFVVCADYWRAVVVVVEWREVKVVWHWQWRQCWIMFMVFFKHLLRYIKSFFIFFVIKLKIWKDK